jgi:septal ring factor EnvC (AmiA/AmiB activator)
VTAGGWLRLAVLGGMAAGLLAAPSAGLAKEKRDPLTQKIERQREALEKIQEEIKQKKRSSEQAERKMESVLESIQELDARLMQSRLERQEIGRKLKQKDHELEEINTVLASLRTRMGERRRSLLARLRIQYMEGRMGALKVLLASDSYADLHRRYQYLAAVSRREYDLLQDYQHDAQRLEQVERQRAAARDAMLSLKEDTERKLSEVQEGKRRKNLFLARITEEKESYDRMVAELERSAGRVDSLLKELLEQRTKMATAQIKQRGGKSHTLLGQFLWPADGDVVARFGRQKHPQFNTYVHRKGIDIRAPEGSGIRAVMAGTVAFADWLKGYGLVVILDHANGFFSLYAHASALVVKSGDRVQAGQTIGTTGDTGMTNDNTLYFELREGAEPVDPLIWLAKRK